MIYSVGCDHFLSIYTFLYTTNLYLCVCVYTFFFIENSVCENFFSHDSEYLIFIIVLAREGPNIFHYGQIIYLVSNYEPPLNTQACSSWLFRVPLMQTERNIQP